MAKKKSIAVKDDIEQSEMAVDAGASKVKDAKEESVKEQKESDRIQELEEALSDAKQEAKENYDSFLRATAELENFKKRANKELVQTRKYAAESLLKELLGVVDNLERAIKSTAENEQNGTCITEGVTLTLNEILKIFEKSHVTPIESLGETFDPNFHQAISQEERDDQPGNTVTQEFQKGYMIHDRLLRPAMVVVSKESVSKKKTTD